MERGKNELLIMTRLLESGDDHSSTSNYGTKGSSDWAEDSRSRRRLVVLRRGCKSSCTSGGRDCGSAASVDRLEWSVVDRELGCRWKPGWLNVALDVVGEGWVGDVALRVWASPVHASGEWDNVVELGSNVGVLLHSHVHGVTVDLVSQHDVTDGGRNVVDDGGVVVLDLLLGQLSSWHLLPIVGVGRPDNRLETKTGGDCSDSVVDVTVRWSPSSNGNTGNVTDGLGGVVELGEDLRVGESSHVWVRPSVGDQVVTVDQTSLSLERPVEDVGTNVEHGSLLLLLLEEVVEGVVGTVGTVIKGETPGLWLVADHDVGGDVGVLRLSTLVASCTGGPPAVWICACVVSDIGEISSTGTRLWCDVWHAWLDLLPQVLSLCVVADDVGGSPDLRLKRRTV